MAWFVQAQEIADADGKGSGKWRMTAKSDEDSGGPYGNPSCYHDSPQEADECEACDGYTAGFAGFPSRKRMAEEDEASERAEYERLKEKFESDD